MSDLDQKDEILLAIERRFHFDPKFHELVSVMAAAIETKRLELRDIEDALTLLKETAAASVRPWRPPL